MGCCVWVRCSPWTRPGVLAEGGIDCDGVGDEDGVVKLVVVVVALWRECRRQKSRTTAAFARRISRAWRSRSGKGRRRAPFHRRSGWMTARKCHSRCYSRRSSSSWFCCRHGTAAPFRGFSAIGGARRRFSHSGPRPNSFPFRGATLQHTSLQSPRVSHRSRRVHHHHKPPQPPHPPPLLLVHEPQIGWWCSISVPSCIHIATENSSDSKHHSLSLYLSLSLPLSLCCPYSAISNTSPPSPVLLGKVCKHKTSQTRKN